jgi:SAM-dependent methyltransferase
MSPDAARQVQLNPRRAERTVEIRNELPRLIPGIVRWPMDDPAGQIRASYDAIGSRFLENARDRSAIAPWLDRFASALPVGARVVDLGAGPGIDSAILRRRGLRVVSLDLSLGMLRAGLNDFHGPRIQADTRQLPLATATVAGVWANASLLHLRRAELPAALAEVRRVLRAPGLLYVSVKRGTGAEWESDRYGQPRFFQYWTEAALDAALHAGGFSIRAASVSETPRAVWLLRLASV